MKLKFLLLIFFVIVFFHSNAQTTSRRITFRPIGRDSVNLPLNEDYCLIEDSCATIIRYGRYNFKNHAFFGPFKDVSKADPRLIVSEGSYTADGKKEGAFVMRYLNGNVRAKGQFRNNDYDGSWEVFYTDGKPEVSFEVTGGEYKIINAWKPDGGKTVDNGTGVYVDDLNSMYWKGKLMNGRPDGTWKLMRKDDITNTALITEYFKKGKFHDGVSTYMNYSDSSHIKFMIQELQPLINAEKMVVSQAACDGSGKTRHIVNAQYSEGLDGFSQQITNSVSTYFRTVSLNNLDNSFTIEGEISTKGALTKMESHQAFREDIARGVIMHLRTLPLLHPATVDGQPVAQKFTITFNFSNNGYQFRYRFLAIQ